MAFLLVHDELRVTQLLRVAGALSCAFYSDNGVSRRYIPQLHSVSIETSEKGGGELAIVQQMIGLHQRRTSVFHNVGKG
ncbi:Uncharacterised protein [Chlamydia trachomatis]|nr:Uncharacterised protein [Chlamydia trachomatis]